MNLKKIKSVLSSEIHPHLEKPKNYRAASVLIVIYGNRPKIIMTEKPKHMKLHAGEISFPGGKYEKRDNDLLDTALRETNEEIGLKISRNQVVGQLQPVFTLNSKFMILPFVSVIENIPELSSNAEVKEIFHIPLESFLKTIRDDPDPAHNFIQEMYVFEYHGKIIWGASARMLKQIRDNLEI